MLRPGPGMTWETRLAVGGGPYWGPITVVAAPPRTRGRPKYKPQLSGDAGGRAGGGAGGRAVPRRRGGG